MGMHAFNAKIVFIWCFWYDEKKWALQRRIERFFSFFFTTYPTIDRFGPCWLEGPMLKFLFISCQITGFGSSKRSSTPRSSQPSLLCRAASAVVFLVMSTMMTKKRFVSWLKTKLATIWVTPKSQAKNSGSSLYYTEWQICRQRPTDITLFYSFLGIFMPHIKVEGKVWVLFSVVNMGLE